MLGSNINSVGWPACGEADIMENIGSYPNTNWGSLHAPSFDPSQTWVLNSPNVYHTDYHLFQASWTPNSFTFLVDGNVYHSQNINSDAKWPFNEPMFFILNVAVGGNWPGNPDSSTLFPQTMLADYVRVYHLTGPTSNEVISLFSSANNKFVSAENAGSSALDCNRTSASTWEQFLVVDLGSNKVALQSQANGKYVTVTTGKSPTLIADSDKIATASTFAWTPNADGTAYLKSMSLGRYVGVDTTKNPPAMVVADVAPKAQDAFGITCYGQLAATSAPTAPQNLVVKAGPNSLKLTWSKVAGASSYQIYRSALPGGSGMVPLASLTATTYTNSSLNWGIGYSYAVTALNSQGMSLRSSVVTASPLRG